ncbi:methylation-associated defense system restriction endonuclease subunit S MAD5 [Nonomuraea sp. KM90]|uniref:methylation-associated defense system restriction endonuclease subunit S MAD5 n=1 Tax=Nonomuraea sp. KM90 TaxID=3457428 RepID=UPI003FCCDDB4
MKLASIDNPVRLSWLTDQSHRLDASPYLSGSYEAKKLLERFPRTQPLMQLTEDNAGIFHAGRVSRRWVTDPIHGIPFFSSTDILEADFSHLPLISRKSVKENPRLLIKRDWTLITRSGTVGRIAYGRPDLDGFACSEHVMRVAADGKKILPGYLYAFLSSRYGIPMIISQASGSIIQHIEPDSIADLPIPRFDGDVETRIHELIQWAAELRAKFQAGVNAATRDLFESAGIPELLDLRWHDQPRDVDFTVSHLRPETLRALNYSPRIKRIIERIGAVPHRTLGAICTGGQLSRGNRFVRIDSAPQHGIKLVGQRQGFWTRPEGRWITLKPGELTQVLAKDETVLMAARGTLGEHEVYCRSLFVTGSWLKNAYSEDFLRIVSGDPQYPGAYLFAFLRSEAMFRVFRSMSTGGKQQDIHEGLRQRIPVPECTLADRERIAETVRQAYRWRDEADVKEDQALALLDDAVREAAR